MIKKLFSKDKKVNLLALYCLALIIVGIEMFQAILFFKGVNGLLTESVSKNANFIIFLLLSLFFIYYAMNYVYYRLVQRVNYDKEMVFLEKKLNTYGFRRFYEVINDFHIRLPFEILQRGGLGYYGALFMFLSRATVIVFSLVYISYQNYSILILILMVSVPVFLSSATIFFLQKRVGRSISFISNKMSDSVSEKTIKMTVTNKSFSDVFEKNHRLINLNSKTQSLSSVSKPATEFFVFFSAYIFILFFDISFSDIDPILIAVLYRIYGNSISAISLLSLLYSSKDSVDSISHELTDDKIKTSELTELITKKCVGMIHDKKNLGIEIRGESGKGKTTALEKIFQSVSGGEDSFYYASNINAKDMKVDCFLEYVGIDKKIIDEFSNFNLIKNLKVNDNLSSLSLGQLNTFIVVCSLLSSKKMVFLDEPLANIDNLNRKKIRSLIEASSKEKVIVITNHEEPIYGFGLEILY